ncbi:MAG: DUF2497 domain-containing protein [Hyphomicrobium sp.]
MSKPQLASEPSMEEILASIRKMISDDRPGPSPMPDQMGRTPFGESRTGAAVDPRSQPRQPTGTPAQQGDAPASNFNSLADALKVATALSDQRRSLQQEIASVLEKGPQRADPQPAASKADAHSISGAGSKPVTDSGGHLPNFPDWRAEQAAAQSDAKRELMSFDFGTVVPQREDASAKAAAAEAKPAAEPATSKVDTDKSEGRTEAAEEPRVLPLRTGLNGSAAHGLNGTAAPNVAAFPRPLREPARPVADAVAPTVEKAPEKPAKVEMPAPTSAEPATSVGAAGPASPSEAASAHTEALLDAVVEMVQQQPDTLSVFTSGASFIGGIGAKKAVADAIASASAATAGNAEKADASSAPGAPPKMDRAAAELLRPMLRQWLAENMPRIVEDALRSELTDTQGDGKDPAKS